MICESMEKKVVIQNLEGAILGEKMKKKILVISTSPRRGGNSELLADEFIRGAQNAGHQVEKVCLYDKTIGFCRGCLTCQKTRHCVIQDDANDIVERMLHADVIAFATPIYFYEMCGQMKTLLDRSNPLFPAEYAFRDIYLLATAADVAESAMDGAVNGLQGWIDCFEKTWLAGVVRGVGVDERGAIKDHCDTMASAFQMGKRI